MTLESLYQTIGGNYAEVLERLMKPERITKYVKRFATAEDYAQLTDCLNKKDYAEAFRHVHDLKGVSANLAFTDLFTASSALCEALRNGPPTIDIAPLVAAVDAEYARVIAALAQLD